MRSTWLTHLASLALVSAALTGCSDDAAVQRAQDQKKFDAALAKLARADLGYVPMEDHTATPDLQDYRQAKLAEATGDLQKIANDTNNSAGERNAAQRLLADAYTSKARYLTRNAVSSWSRLANDSTRLLALLTTVDRANARAGELTGDYVAPMLASLEKDKTENDHTLQDFEKAVSELGPKVEDLKKQIAALQNTSEDALKKSRELYDKGFTASGDEQFKLYEESAKAERESTSAEAKRRTLGVQLEVVSAELAISTRQTELRKKTSQAYADQIHAAEERQSARRKLQDDAITQQKKAVEDLERELAKTSDAYAKTVQSDFDGAAEAVRQAITLLDQSAKAATGADQKQTQLDLLAKYTTLANILTQHAAAASGYGRVLEILASQADRLMPKRAAFADDAKRVSAKRDQVFEEATEAISAGSGLSAQLMPAGASADDQTVIAATAHRDLLDRYTQQLNQLRTPTKPRE